MAPKTTPDWDEIGESYPSLRRAMGRRIAVPERRELREPAPINERLLQCIWYDGHFHAENLRLADGRSAEIRSPGRWNAEAGPDFHGAEIVIDGERAKGDVELHLRASDWRAHRHGGDPAYRTVILHVVLDIDDGQVSDATPTGGAIPRLELRPVLHGDLESLGHVITMEDYPYERPAMVGRCHRLLSQLDRDDQVTAFFEAAAVRRMKGKIERLESQLGGADFEQVFHQALLTAMGHRGSKTLFFLLAKRVPIAELRALTRPWTGRARALAAEAVLLHVANLIRPQPQTEPTWDEETMAHVDALHRVWAELGGHFSDRLIPQTAKWHQGIRPVNFPSRRIAGLSHLAVGEVAGEEGLFTALMRRCEEFAESGRDGKIIQRQLGDLVALLAVDEPSDHWARRHTLGGKRLAKTVRLIGEGRARSVLFNALLPLAILWAKRRRRRRVLEWAHAALREFPALEENTVTRFMKYRLFTTTNPPKSLFRREMRQQALFHIFTDCCDSVTTSCDQCAFFARLTQ
jgi:hypothetical protein